MGNTLFILATALACIACLSSPKPGSEDNGNPIDAAVDGDGSPVADSNVGEPDARPECNLSIDIPGLTSSYFFGSNESWYDAQAHCTSMGAHLAVLSDEDETAALLEAWKNDPDFSDSFGQAGIGGAKVDDVWEWVVDDEATTPGEAPIGWVQGQPSSPMTELCLGLFRDTGQISNAVGDVPCGDRRIYICECDRKWSKPAYR